VNTSTSNNYYTKVTSIFEIVKVVVVDAQQ